MDLPTISAIVPTSNRQTLVGDAIDSILRQNYPGLEVIVVDDGSTDATADRLAGYGAQIRSVRQTNAGPAAARNRGLALANGKLIGFLDSDDLWPEDKLRRQVSFLQAHPEVDIVLGYSQILRRSFDDDGGPRFVADSATQRVFQLGCGLYRRSVFQRVGPFDPRLRYWEDEDWFARARANAVRMVCLRETTLTMRFHSDNMTRTMEAANPCLLKFLKSHRDRTRAAHPRRDDEPSTTT